MIKLLSKIYFGVRIMSSNVFKKSLCSNVLRYIFGDSLQSDHQVESDSPISLFRRGG